MSGTCGISKKRTIIIIAALLIIATGIGGFFAGKSTEAAKHQEEQELSIALNKSKLDALAGGTLRYCFGLGDRETD